MGIQQLNQGTPSAASQIPFYDPQNGQDRRASLNDIASLLSEQIALPAAGFKQRAAPNATGFSVTVQPLEDGQSGWLLLTPLAGYAAGAVVLPALATLADDQELLITTTQAVTALTVSNGGATVNGAPTTLAANAFFRLRFDTVNSSWYRVG